MSPNDLTASDPLLTPGEVAHLFRVDAIRIDQTRGKEASGG